MDNSPISKAGPSNPVRLLVKTRDPSSSSPGAASASSAVKASLARKSEQVRKAEKWGDRMMEETLSPKDFRRGIKYISPSAYSEIEHERHLNHLCSYPLCANPPRREYRQGPRYSISTTKRSIKEVEGNREEGFCSPVCQTRSGWVAGQLDKRRDHDPDEGQITLLEELPPEEQEARMSPRKASGTLQPGARLRNGPLSAPVDNPTSKASATGISGLETLVGEITIHERPTPAAPPVPPSLTPSAPPPQSTSPSSTPRQPLSSSASRATPPSATPKAPTTRRAAGSAMVSTPTKLVSSILTSSRQNPGRQMEPDTDSSESSLDPDEENPLGMGGWSEDEDVKALFEEAKAARELMDNDKADE